MTKGKMIAQGSHASLRVLLDMMSRETKDENKIMELNLNEHPEVEAWLSSGYRKICVYVNSEEELTALKEKADELGIPNYLETDWGLTHFKGVKTKTALAIGPYTDEKINEITGHLRLL